MRCEAFCCEGFWTVQCDLDAVKKVGEEMLCESHARMEEASLAKIASGEWETPEESHKRIKYYNLAGNQVSYEEFGRLKKEEL